MNVVKYSIEASVKGKKNSFPITDLMTECLKNRLQYNDDFQNSLLETWDQFPNTGIKTLYSSNYLIGTFTKNKIQIFIFRDDINKIRPNDSCSIDILAIGDLGIDNIVNDSFAAVTKILDKMKCDFIKDSKIFLYPYDNSQKDIWSPELKIKADYDPPYIYEKKDLVRIFLVSLITIIFLILYLIAPSTIKNENGQVLTNNIEIVYRTLFLSGFFYLIIDALINFIIPSLFYRKKKNIKIKDLSNFIELTDDNPFSERTKLSTPSIPE